MRAMLPYFTEGSEWVSVRTQPTCVKSVYPAEEKRNG